MTHRQHQKHRKPIQLSLIDQQSIRIVQLTRNKNGFGFTLSGEKPCILTEVKGHALAAGLRNGDYLISVNNCKVAKWNHEDVVKLIVSASNGYLRLEIATDNCNSSDSSDGQEKNREKQRYSYRKRHQINQRNEKLNEIYNPTSRTTLSLPSGLPSGLSSGSASSMTQINSNKKMVDLVLKHRLANFNDRLTNFNDDNESDENIALKLQMNNHSSMDLFDDEMNKMLCYNKHESSVSSNEEDAHCRALLRAVVGYLGTIEMPKEPQIPGAQLQSIKNCIRRLRIEKKVHTTILLAVYPDGVKLVKINGEILAEFPAEKIVFCGVYSDNKSFFGLVTSSGSDSNNGLMKNHELDLYQDDNQPNVNQLNVNQPNVESSNSCHVFLTSPPSTHQKHYRRAKAFGIKCTLDPVNGNCLEFPESADPILRVIVGLYRNRLGIAPPALANIHLNLSPLHSSSNSDSGIHEIVKHSNEESHDQNVGNSKQDDSVELSQRFNGDSAQFDYQIDDRLLSKIDYLNGRKINYGNDYYRDDNNENYLRINENRYSSEDQNRYSSDHVSNQSSNNIDLKKHSSFDRFDKNKNLIEQQVKNGMISCEIDLSLNSERLDSQLNAANVRQTVEKYFKLKEEMEKRKEKDEQLNEQLNSGVNCIALGDADTEIGSQDVHPPTTQDDSSSNYSEGKIILNTKTAKRWIKPQANINAHYHINENMNYNQNNKQMSSSMIGFKIKCDSNYEGCERPIDVGWVGSWASNFEHLLSDQVGLKIFSEFLRREFSYENIKFYMICENFKKIQDKEELKVKAKYIFDRFVAVGSPEAVNVDSQARLIVESGLENTSSDLFDLAQKQVFTLMKLDCYPRFLKSDLYKECLHLEQQGKPLPFQFDSKKYEFDLSLKQDNSNKNSNKINEKKNKTKKKSIFSWPKTKKSYKAQEEKREIKFKTKKQRPNSVYNCAKSGQFSSSDLSGSQSSLNEPKDLLRQKFKVATLETDKPSIKDSFNMKNQNQNQCDQSISSSSIKSKSHFESPIHTLKAISKPSSPASSSCSPGHCNRENCHFSMVILPDRSTAMVKTHNYDEKIGHFIGNLLEKRKLNCSSFEVYATGTEKAINLNESVSTIGCQEIRVEQRVIFKLDLPCNKLIEVKVKPTRNCAEVCKTVLNHFGYRFEHVVIQIATLSKPVNLNSQILSVDNQKLIVSFKDDLDEWGWDAIKSKMPVALHEKISKFGSIQKFNRIDNNGSTEDQSQTKLRFIDYEAVFVEKKLEDSNGKSMNSIEKDKSVSHVKAIDSFSKDKSACHMKAVDSLSKEIISNESFSTENKSDSFFQVIMRASQHVPDENINTKSSFSPTTIKQSLTANQQLQINTNPKPKPRTILFSSNYKDKIKFSNCNLSPIEPSKSTTNLSTNSLTKSTNQFVINDIDLDATLLSLKKSDLKSLTPTLSSSSTRDLTSIPSSLKLTKDYYNYSSLYLEKENYYHLNHHTNSPANICCDIKKPPLRKLPSDPPPLPPKAKLRGPPPRPPSRLYLSNQEVNRSKILENYI